MNRLHLNQPVRRGSWSTALSAIRRNGLVTAGIVIWLVSLGISVSNAQQDAGPTDEELISRLDKALDAVTSFRYGDDGDALVKDLERVVFHLAPDSPLRPVVEKKLIAALDKATPDGRAVLCRQLFVIGTDRCIPALEKWLSDPETGNFALYAMGRNPSPLVDEVLRRSLSRLGDPIRLGIIDLLGQRRVQRALPDLARLLSDSNEQIVAATVRAIGRIGGKDAVAVLQKMQPTSPTIRREIDQGLLLCGELFLREDDRTSAAAIYREFYSNGESLPLRQAGLRGLVAAQPDDTRELLIDLIKTEDPHFGRYAVSLILELPDPSVLTSVAALLPDVSDDMKLVLLRTLAGRSDRRVEPDVLNCLRDTSHSDVRAEALAALGQVGSTRAIPDLLNAAATGEGKEKSAAAGSLVFLSGEGIDAAIVEIALQTNQPPALRAAAIETIGRRRAANLNNQLLRLLRDDDQLVQSAAAAALASLATEKELPAMLDSLDQPLKPEGTSALIDACRQILMRIEDAETRADLVLSRLATAPDASKAALLPLLACSGTDEALRAVYAAHRSSNNALKTAAVETLASWPNAEPVQYMLDVFLNAQDGTTKQAALKGCIRLANLSDRPSDIYLRMLDAVDQVSDQKQILEGIGMSCDTPEMLQLALNYMERNPNLRPNAGLAAVHIANRLRTRDPKLAKDALVRVRGEVQHADVERRALAVLNEIDKQQGYIFEWLIAGPYQEKGKEGAEIYATPFPPETADASKVAWKPIERGKKTWSIDLEQALGSHDFCAAYLRTFVWSDVEREAAFEAGADDTIKVWLNGQLCYERWRTGGPEPRSMRAKIQLEKGWNELLVKVVDQQGGWEFGGRIRQPNGLELEGLKFRAERP